jgi:hypothetical protein
MRTWTETAFQVQSRVWLTWVAEPRWGHWMRCSRSRYEFSDDTPGVREAAYAKALAKIAKLEKADLAVIDAKYRVEYRIVKITKTTTIEPV